MAQPSPFLGVQKYARTLRVCPLHTRKQPPVKTYDFSCTIWRRHGLTSYYLPATQPHFTHFSHHILSFSHHVEPSQLCRLPAFSITICGVGSRPPRRRLTTSLLRTVGETPYLRLRPATTIHHYLVSRTASNLEGSATGSVKGGEAMSAAIMPLTGSGARPHLSLWCGKRGMATRIARDDFFLSPLLPRPHSA